MNGMGLMKIGNYHLYVERYGHEKATPIIFLHGGPGDGCMLLSNLAQKLGENYYCICFDQMGCGRSDQIPDDVLFGMSQHVDMIERLRQELHIKKAIIYGHGYGGMLACLYAAKYPHSVLGVIYDCPSYDFADSTKSLARFLYRETFIYKSKTSAGYRQCIKSWMQRIYPEIRHAWKICKSFCSMLMMSASGFICTKRTLSVF